MSFGVEQIIPVSKIILAYLQISPIKDFESAQHNKKQKLDQSRIGA